MDPQTIERARAVDLVGLIGRDVVLHGNSNGESWGACPFCGGTDRLHVKPGGWFCRQCTGEPGGGGGRWLDAIDYVQRRDGCDFKEAVAALAGAISSGFRPARAAVRPQAVRPADWQDRARALCADAQAALWTDAGQQARDWLRERGLGDDVIRAAGLGYVGAAGRYHGLYCERGIVIPWPAGGAILKVNVRRPVGEPKYRAMAGSRNGGLYLADILTTGKHRD